jgi:hypothetical protein
MILPDVYYRSLLLLTVLRAPAEPDDGGTVPQPKTGGSLPSGLAAKVEQALGLIAWVGTAAGVVGILATGAVMAISHKRGESSEHMSRLGMVLGGCILVALAGPIVTWVFGDGGGGGESN